MRRLWAVFAAISIVWALRDEKDVEEIRRVRSTERSRNRRQFDARNGPQIDLNITVPYIFSARLYPYGISKGDQMATVDPQPVDLHTPLRFFNGTYQTVFIHKDGVIAVSPTNSFFPPPDSQMPLIAVFWMQSRGGKVFYRETTDPAIMSLVQSEVNIQYRYGNSLKPRSVLIVTWDGGVDSLDPLAKEGNTFQIALILTESKTFAHIVYSRLRSNNNAAAGFSGVEDSGGHFSLPGSGTSDAVRLVQKSNLGIPGEWLFRIDEEQIHLCGAGFRGLECVDTCESTQWYLDCSRSCHCADGVNCNFETGVCPTEKCSPGWMGFPSCDQDIDECDSAINPCPREQPDCVNTAGAFLCLCFEYDNITNTCKGSSADMAERIPVSVMPLVPNIKSLASTTAKQTPFTHLAIETSTLTTEIPKTIELQTREPLTIKPLLISPQRSSIPPSCPICDRNGHCVGVECVCNNGWSGDGIHCVDVDECQNDGICGINAECQNTPGSYQCVCNVGFVATENGCVDLDECAAGLVTCRGGNAAICVNKPGSFECQCAAGYLGNPDSLEGCIDINECDSPELYCGNRAKCTNLAGSFECECFEGYEKSRNGSHCTDVNECLLSPCDSAAVCTNLDGTFRCECVDGYVGNGVECRETILFPVGKNGAQLPNLLNSVLPYRLESPIHLFGHNYETAYISANGVLSFDRPFTEMIGNPREVRSVSVFPLHLPFDLSSGGTVTIRQVNEGDAANYGLLTRASLLVQNKYNLKKFQSTSLLIATYDKVSVVGTNQTNTFQFALAQSSDSIFYIFLYEQIESRNAPFVGFTYPSGFVELPSDSLESRSNIAQRGKWLFRIDRVGAVGLCPSGKLNPPFCETDCSPGTWGFQCVNNCHCADGVPCDFATGFCANAKCVPGFAGPNCYDDVNECQFPSLNKCHLNASCTNTFGSYKCQCFDRFVGDGYNCKPLDGCYERFNKYCASNAYCDETNVNYPECVCHEGFHGDGRRLCEPDVKTSSTTTSQPETTTRQRVIISNAQESTEADETPFVKNPWNSVEETTKTVRTTTVLPTTRKHSTSTPPNPQLSENDLIVGHQSEESAGMMFLIIPGVLVGVWFVLVIVVLVIFCRRRKRGRANKYSPQMMGWTPRDYSTPTATRSAAYFASLN